MASFITLFISLSYLGFLILLIIGWSRIKVESPFEHKALFVSVVIPVRNEAWNIQRLIRCLEEQNFPRENFEVIVVDDHSMDGTLSLLEKMQKASAVDLKIFSLPDDTGSNISHKKEAITYAVDKARGEIVILTDGDVYFGKDWLRTYVGRFSSSDHQMVVGPVLIRADDFMEEIEAIEFSSLIGTAAALLHHGWPTMCNGANLAFRKKAFHEVNGYAGNEEVISGDDEFLLYKMSKKFHSKVSFLKEKEATIWVDPAAGFNEFYNQRLRWAGKWNIHVNIRNTMLAIYIFIVHLNYIAIVALGLLKFIPMSAVMLSWGMKILIEYIFIRLIYNSFNQKLKFMPYTITSLLYSFYAVTFGILSNFKGFVWKGRRYKN